MVDDQCCLTPVYVNQCIHQQVWKGFSLHLGVSYFYTVHRKGKVCKNRKETEVDVYTYTEEVRALSSQIVSSKEILFKLNL